MKYTYYIFLSLFMVLSCKEKGNEVIPEQFTGITETTLSPDPIGDFDPDDWKPLMDCPPPDTGGGSRLPNCTKAYPVYPNPAVGSCVFTFALSQNDSVIISLFAAPRQIKQVVAGRWFSAGLHQLTIDLHEYQPGIYRLYFFVDRPGHSYETYGDIKVIQ